MAETSAINPRCRKCGRDLGSSFLYSGDGFTYHSECYPVSPLNAEIASLRTALAIQRERDEKAEKAAEQARVETGEAMLVIEQQDRDLEAVQGKLESVWNKSVSREASLAEAKRLLRPFADAANLAAQRSAKRPHDFAITEDFYAAARFLAQEEGR